MKKLWLIAFLGVAVACTQKQQPAPSEQQPSSVEQQSVAVSKELHNYFLKKLGGINLESYCKLAAMAWDGTTGINKDSYSDVAQEPVEFLRLSGSVFITQQPSFCQQQSDCKGRGAAA